MRIYLLLMLILTCSTPQVITIQEKPKDVQPVINEVKQSPELKVNPVLKNKIENALLECKNYSDKMQSNYNICIESLERQKDLINKYKIDIVKLEEEVYTWHKIKYTAYAIIGMAILGTIVRLLYPILIKFIKPI